MTSVTTYTFTATDVCGNSITDVATVTIVDTTPPQITCPEDLILECGDASNDALISAWLASVSATDECNMTSPVSVINSYDISGFSNQCGLTGTQVVTFTATDDCLNTRTCTASIIILDTTDPAITQEAIPETVECNGSGNLAELNDWLNRQGDAIATDVCSDDPLLWTYELLTIDDNCNNTGIFNYRFTVTDNCGNTASTDAAFTIVDVTPPSIDIEAEDIEVICDGSNNADLLLNWLNNNGFASASDICSNITWSNNYGTIDPGACQGEGSIDVIFTATDECGNTSTTEATLTIVDNNDPVWTIDPTDLELECTEDVDPLNAIQAWLDAAGTRRCF